MDQRARMATLDDFRRDRIALLVASDVAARGLDIPAVSHIFNFDVPAHAEDYVHRIGRTGRAGLTGTAITIATPTDRKYLAAIERMLGKPIPAMDVPAAVEERARAFNKGRAEREEARAHRDHGEADGERARDTRHRRRSDHRRAGGRTGSRDAAPAAPANGTHWPPKSSENRQAHPRTEKPRQREERPAGGETPRPETRPQRRDDDRRRERPHRERSAPVVGMGDHMPDFLRRPVKIPSGS
jgi:superfamily II DNA/RNA helicase